MGSRARRKKLRKVDQDFSLLFNEDTSSRMLQKWDVFFKSIVTKDAKCLTSTPELRCLMRSAERFPADDQDEVSVVLQFERTSLEPVGSDAVPPRC
ncbi:hypothetical protein CHARACLAT_007303 [Characodon lateralis]|uniref:Uncharacterized protein n=1 Tax=Characodon lateralis TaxID=208331 RepID=A0ABU7CVM4_9TELE|nr:hypothetical protein [Characodon lateralis]